MLTDGYLALIPYGRTSLAGLVLAMHDAECAVRTAVMLGDDGDVLADVAARADQSRRDYGTHAIAACTVAHSLRFCCALALSMGSERCPVCDR